MINLRSLILILTVLFSAYASKSALAQSSSDAPLTVSPDFKNIASQLDLDGVRVNVTSGTYEREGMQPFLDYLEQMMALSVLEGESYGISEDVVGHFKEFGHALGLDEIVARGESTARLPGGGFISKSVVQVDPESDGLLWDLQGDPQKVETLVSRFPADTTLLLHSSVHASRLFDRVLDMIAELPDTPEDPRGQLEALLEAQGLSLDALLETLNQGMTFAVTLNEDIEWLLPVSGGATIPSPGLVLTLQDVSRSLGPFLVQQMRANSPIPILETEIDGVMIPYLGIPLPVATPVALHITTVDDRLIITSSAELMREMLQREKQPSPAPLLTKLAPLGEDIASSGFWMSDGRLFEAQRNLALQIMEGMPQQDEKAALMFGTISQMSTGGHPLFALPEIMLMDREGDFFRVRMLHEKALLNTSSSTSLMAVPAVGGLLAAIALPSFQKARTTAQENACIHNLRMISSATDQWAIENNHTTKTPVTLKDLEPYLRNTPIECPAGGAYSLTIVGEKPTCSEPEHELP